MAEVDSCTRCELEVTNNAEALQCDLCSGWEHRICIRECDRPSVELYAALTTAPSKAILLYARSVDVKVTLRVGFSSWKMRANALTKEAKRLNVYC